MADADALRYLRIAKADLLEARRMLDLSGFRDSSIGFLLQQACEKSFKSWIHSSGGMAPFTHDLVALMELPDNQTGLPFTYEHDGKQRKCADHDGHRSIAAAPAPKTLLITIVIICGSTFLLFFCFLCDLQVSFAQLCLQPFNVSQ
jgi:HEPN domain-containing protein